MEQLSSIKICNCGSFSGNTLSEYSLYLKLQQHLLFCSTPSVKMSVVSSVKCLASVTKLAVYTCKIQTAAFEMEVAVEVLLRLFNGLASMAQLTVKHKSWGH